MSYRSFYRKPDEKKFLSLTSSLETLVVKKEKKKKLVSTIIMVIMVTLRHFPLSDQHILKELRASKIKFHCNVAIQTHVFECLP